MPEQPAAEPNTPAGNLSISLLILSIVAYNFASYLTIGLPLLTDSTAPPYPISDASGMRALVLADSCAVPVDVSAGRGAVAAADATRREPDTVTDALGMTAYTPAEVDTLPVADTSNGMET